MKEKSVILKITALTVSLCVLFSTAAFADNKYGPGNLNGDRGGTESVSGEQAPDGTVSGLQPGAVITDNSAYNGSTVLEDGRPVADPILGVVPQLHAQYKTGDGNLTDGFITGQDFFNSPMDGFSGFRCRLEYSIGDVYYRVRTDEHGWTRWGINERDTDWFNDAAKVTAIQMFLKGYTANSYDLFYRVELNDGTVTDWAHNGQSCGAIGTGQYIQKMQTMLWKKGVPFYQPTSSILRAANYEGVTGSAGSIRYSKADGSAYTGWGYDTLGNKYYFVDNAPVTGWQNVDGYRYYFDESGRVVTDLEPVMGLQPKGSYRIRVSKEMNTMTVLAKDENGSYVIPYKVFLVTTGTATPIGEFKTYDPNRWKFMHDDIYVQYLMRYKDNGFCIHSIIYYPEAGSYNLRANSYNELGKNASDGCIRLLSGDCAWVYNNCGVGTAVEIYNDSWSFGPYDRPCIEQAIPAAQNWDPTDPEVLKDIENHTGPFVNGVVTVAYPDEFIPRLSNHGDSDLASVASAAAGYGTGTAGLDNSAPIEISTEAGQ